MKNSVKNGIKYTLLSPVFIICGILTLILVAFLVGLLWNGVY